METTNKREKWVEASSALASKAEPEMPHVGKTRDTHTCLHFFVCLKYDMFRLFGIHVCSGWDTNVVQSYIALEQPVTTINFIISSNHC